MLRRPLGWFTAALAGAISAVFVTALTDRATVGGEGYAALPWGLHFGFSAFSVSGWLALGGLFLAFALWEAVGRAPSILGYFLAAPVLAAAGLTAFVALLYDYPPAFSLGMEEARLFAAAGAFGLWFAIVRKSARKTA